ncbi:MAG: carbohydrate kinase family protein [Hyphomicrobiales bacterium]
MTRSGIVLAGTVVLDVVHMIGHWPDEEQIAFIRETIEAPGGPPHNAAAGLVRLGAPFPVSLICLVGDDPAANTFISKAGDLGLETARVIRATGQTTDVTHVMTSMATGRRTFFVQPGANATMSAEQMMPPDDTGKIYYLGSPGISSSMDASDGWRTALRKARARGFKTAMELCPVPAALQRAQTLPCLALLDYFVINDSEAEILSGLPVSRHGRFDRTLAFAAAQKLLDLGVAELVGIHHPEGAVALRKTGEQAFAPSVNVPQSEIVGTVGAGDAFYAGMLFGLHEDWPLAQCLALGNASAATSLHSATTSASIRPWQQCLAYAAEKGLRG